MAKHDPDPIISGFQKLLDFPAFESFAKALWRHEAAVMVGAGFSTMCHREPDSPAPPLWQNFADRMSGSLGCDRNKGPDPLRLAQEYRALHGEEGLERLILDLVTDQRWTPGELHRQLLELPWQDVLTTNWDTLLERTAPNTPDRIYQSVLTVQDIARASRPRIVKLHGSLPSQRPFIFTEDDFRTYPQRFAPYVNLAQQVMLENELCLLGFSGTDPNFLAWSGWVRDTLGAAARRIRLIGVLDMTPSERLVLEQRHVTPIDLADLVKDLPREEQHREATRLLLLALNEMKPPSPFDWESQSKLILTSSSTSEEDRLTRAEVASEWRRDRLNYPGWIVAPNREQHNLRFSPHMKRSDDTPETQLQFATERIWRHHTAGLWLLPNDMEAADKHYDAAKLSLPRSLRCHLCATVAAEWRKYQRWDEWSRWMERLARVGEGEAQLCHSYEKGLKALLCWDDEALLSAADDLRNEEPLWMMRRASLLAALFYHREAAELYEAALRKIRLKLIKAPDSAWLISLEGWASMFYRVSYPALKDEVFAWPEDDSDETRMRLVRAKADPWEIVTSLENLASERIDRNRKDSTDWELSFDSGKYRPGAVVRLGADESCPFYALLDVIERVGAPESIGATNVFSTRLVTAYTALAMPDESDLLALLSRYRGQDQKILDRILRRMDLACLSDGLVGSLLQNIPRRVERLMSQSQARQGRSHSADYIAFLIELMSRLIIRAKTEDAFSAFKWAEHLLHHPRLWWGSYRSISHLLKRSIEPMEGEDRQRAMGLALMLPILGEGGTTGPEHDWPEVFDQFSEEDASAFVVDSHRALRISQLIALVRDASSSDRGRAMRRLHVLHVAGKLSDEQQNALEDAIWSRCDVTGWPEDAQLHPWVYLVLPGHKRANPLFIEHIVKEVANGRLDAVTLMNLRVGLSHMTGEPPKDHLVSCVSACLNWKPEAITDDDPLRIASIHRNDQNKATADQVGYSLAEGILPRLSAIDISDQVKAQWLDLAESGDIGSMSATAFHISYYWPDELPRAVAIIRAAMASRSPDRVIPAHAAVRLFIEDINDGGGLPAEIKRLVFDLLEQRAQPGLNLTLSAARSLTNAGQLDSQEASSLASAIRNILQEYRYNQKALPIPSLAAMPLVRRQALGLMRALAKFTSDLEDLQHELEQDPLPEVRTTSAIEQ